MDTVSLIDSLIEDLALDPEHEGSTAVLIRPNGEVQGFQVGSENAPEFVDQESLPFFLTIVGHTLDCISAWSKYKANDEENVDKKAVWNSLAYTVENSDFLHRMIEGKRTFDERPPRTLRSRWYELLEDGEGIAHTVSFSSYPNATGFAAPTGEIKFATINGAQWQIVANLGEGKYIVTYNDNKTTYLLRKATVEDQARLLHVREERDDKTNAWILIREEENG